MSSSLTEPRRSASLFGDVHRRRIARATILGSVVLLLYQYCLIAMLSHKPQHLFQMQQMDNREETVFVTGWCQGRLGNIIITLANLYAYQEDFGMMPLLPSNHARTICYYFHCKEEIRILQRVVPDWKNRTWVKFDPYKKPLLDPEIRYVDIGSHTMRLRRIKYFLKYVKELKEKFLTIKDEFQEHAKRKIEIAKSIYIKTHDVKENESISYIGIHVRCTDYVKFMKKAWKKQPVDENYFTRAMNMFRESEKHPLFIIVSEDMSTAHSQVVPKNDDCFFKGMREETGNKSTGVKEKRKSKKNIFRGLSVSPDIGKDLALLMQMNHSIRTYGTFALWSALLSDSKTVIWPNGYNGHIRNLSIPGFTYI